jgi:hypothetical protein
MDGPYEQWFHASALRVGPLSEYAFLFPDCLRCGVTKDQVLLKCTGAKAGALSSQRVVLAIAFARASRSGIWPV